MAKSEMGVLKDIKSWFVENLLGGTDINNTVDEREEIDKDAFEQTETEEEGGEVSEIYTPDQIIIKYRARTGDKAIDIEHDYEHIPSESEILEEFGPGNYNIMLQVEGERPKRKKRYNIDGHPLIPVESYELKVRVYEGGKLLDTNVTFPGSLPPTKDAIIASLGGGGFIKLNALNKEGKVIWSDWLDYSDVEAAEQFKRRDDTFKSKLEIELDARKKLIEDEALKSIKEKTGGGKSKFDDTMDRLIGTLEDKKLERLEEAIARFGDKISGTGESGDEKDDRGLTDLAFREPYVMKLNTQKQLLIELAKKDPEEALRVLEKMPDGITIGLKLALAATGLVEGVSDLVKEQAISKRCGHGREKERKSTDDEKGKSAVEKKFKEVLERESSLVMSEKSEGSGFEITFDVDGEALKK